MLHSDMVTSYVRDLLERMTGHRPEPDHDGDLVVQYQGATFFTRVIGRPPVVQVFTVALERMTLTPDLLLALDEINRSLHFARAFTVVDQVLIETEIWGEDVNPRNFGLACENLASATDFFGPRLAERFGGQLRFENTKAESYGAGSLVSSSGYGMYL